MKNSRNYIKKLTIRLWAGIFLVFVMLVGGVIFYYSQYVKAFFNTKTTGDTLTALEWNELPTELNSPPGVIIPFAGSLVPAGWILCDGSEVSRTVTYGNLFAVIGTSFGNGDGSNTFNLPDLRGRKPLGADNMGGVSANNVTSASADTVGSSGGNINGNHFHTGTTDTVNCNNGTGGGVTTASVTHEHDFTTNSTNAMNPYQTVNYIIKY